MKTMKNSLLTAVFTLIAGSLFASGNLKVTMTQSGSKEAVVEASNVYAEVYEIEVRDEYGDLIFFKETESYGTDYQRKYDFSALENGRYYMNVKHGNETFIKHFQLERGNIETLSTAKKIEPFFEFTNNVWKMSYLNLSQEDMGIYIYDRKGLVHEKDLKSGFTVNEGFDLSNLDPGNYSIVFTAGSDVYEKNVTVE